MINTNMNNIILNNSHSHKKRLYEFIKNMLLTKELCRDVLEIIIDKYIIDSVSLRDACLENWFYAIDLLISKGNKINNIHMVIVAEHGYINLVKFFNENWGNLSNDYNCYDYDKHNAIDLASANGHFEVVKYLVENRKKYTKLNSKWMCTTRSIDYACEGGYLEIVKYLYSKKVHGTYEAFQNAFDNNHTHIIIWLNENMSRYYNSYLDRNFYF
jgi:ankyrin repeat protein